MMYGQIYTHSDMSEVSASIGLASLVAHMHLYIYIYIYIYGPKYALDTLESVANLKSGVSSFCKFACQSALLPYTDIHVANTFIKY
jgi:hypothetical protein